LIRKGKIWTAKLRIDHVVIFQASAPRIFSAAASIVSAVEDLAGSAVTGLVVEADSAVIASEAAEDLAAAALGALAVSAAAADSEADGNN
jgi:hypothetical protein